MQSGSVVSKMPTVKHCKWGKCNSDSRYSEKDHMKNVTFFPFPKPSRDLEKAKQWIKMCGLPQDQMSLDKINRYYYVCSKVRLCYTLLMKTTVTCHKLFICQRLSM